MTPLLHPYLVNDRFGDPALYVDFQFEKRALLFDLGDLHGLEGRKLLRVTDVFVSHAHMDHFIGFDQLLRAFLGRDAKLRLYGPAGFIAQVGHKLAGYSWNLVRRYATDLEIVVTEVRSHQRAKVARFRLQKAFRREGLGARELADGLLLDDGILQIRSALLDHQIPCLAFAAQEPVHVNVWKNRLAALDLPVGPWLRDLKHAALQDLPDDRPFRIRWEENGQRHERRLPLGRLKREVLRIVPGQKIGYVVDARFDFRNARRIIALVKDADTLFIEATFAQADSARAAERYHLTTAQAGHLGRLARVARLEPFHFSPRHAEAEDQLRGEVEAAFGHPLQARIRGAAGQP